jgi:hypothetical protein
LEPVSSFGVPVMRVKDWLSTFFCQIVTAYARDARTGLHLLEITGEIDGARPP